MEISFCRFVREGHVHMHRYTRWTVSRLISEDVEDDGDGDDDDENDDDDGGGDDDDDEDDEDDDDNDE